RDELREPPSPAGADHQLAGARAAGELEQRGGDVVADDEVVGAAEVLDEGTLTREGGRVLVGEGVAAGDVDGEDLGVRGPAGDVGGAPQQRLALGPPAE